MEKSENHQVHHRRPKATRRQQALRKRHLAIVLAVSLFCGTVLTWAWLSSRSRSSGSASAEWYDSIPGLELQLLAPVVRAEALQRINRERCTCSCKLSLARCRHTDPTCKMSLPLCRSIVAELQKTSSAN